MTSASGVPAAVVVSGAGSGLGRALAVALAQGGGRVALCGRTAESLEQTAALAIDAGADDVMWQALDVADSEGARRFSAAVAERFGVVGGLVNNAGSLGAIGPISDIDLSEWEVGLRTNVVGTATMTSVFAPLLASAPQASIINLSGAGIGGAGNPERVSSYVASKAAIVALTEVWSRELAPVRVNAVAPGAVDTGFNNRVLEVGEQKAGTDLVKSVEAQVAAPFP
ncbi:MAG: SDR family NAD(P)-dependent oxidoreductase, partial [Actinomycetes bacterium]